MAELFDALILIVVCCTVVIPIINNFYKENMWKYIKERIEMEKGNEILRTKFEENKRKKGKKI